MPRVKRSTKRNDRRKKILDRASGYFLTKSKLYQAAQEAVERGLKFAYTGRRQKKRQFRSLWIVRISAAAKLNGTSYSQFIGGLKKAGVELDRKILADIAVHDAAGFTKLAEQAKAARWLGRKQGLLKDVSDRWLKAAPSEAKKSLGQRFNDLKKHVEDLLEAAEGAGPSDAALAAEAIDITLPGTRRLTGAEHPITRTLNEITSVFAALGYSVGVGPEVETDFYNFECMNFPPGHPARDTQDTLGHRESGARPLRDRLLLRTHTSPVQMRTMERSRRRCAS
jgi:ribosomal protein L20